ncbi:restriction endonuclease subunit S [Vibrio sinensis]|uniref:Restriction endonuclease subunit S n=1 Tax=Vibrio sinensis TaxID=2302434 RepID=A0A3A6QY16_9VIBR|nr:restriction endonuclease subunit S [Vibrio sinensis]RJX73707.1 restriction endonuclease subunit S [Vibrio sinensis]
MNDSNFWQTYALTDLAHYHNGYAFKPDDWRAEGTKIIRIEQLNKPNGRYDYFSGDYPSVNHIEDGDLIFSWSATLKVAIWKHGCGVLNQHLFRVDEKEGFDKHFLYYLLDFHMDALSGGSHGSTMKHIKRGELQTYKVKVPPLPVQKRIAQILISLDNQIDATQALIDKYTAIKQGMMADLFSRGIDPETKAIRPTFEEAPELYHKTPLGMLPKGWDAIELENLLDDVATPMRSGPFGSALLKEELVSEGIPLLGIDNIFVERFKARYKRFVTERKFRELSRYAVRERDVVITIMGTVGRSCVIPESIGLALSSKHLWTMTFDKEQILPELVCWQLNHSPWAESWFRRESQGGVMDAIQSQTLKKLKLVVPPPAEQNAIYERYENLNNHIEVNQTSLDKLKLQKAGLMQDLLTGKVPVPA